MHAQASADRIQPEARVIVELANQARAQAGAGPLQWDPALAEAARQHCLRMAAEGPIAHRYDGEPDLDTRAAGAGAHFSLIEENVAFGPSPERIHEMWMNSPGHRANLLSKAVDRVGVAVVASRGALYAVADYEHAVEAQTPSQVESSIAAALSSRGVTVLSDSTAARAYCVDRHSSSALNQPGFQIMWQDADLSHLPKPLLDALASGHYHQAAVGSCKPEDQEGAFTAYRVAVFLY